MQRRDSLKALTTMALTSAAATSPAPVLGTRASFAAGSGRPATIRTKDGIDLYYRDWGAGRPLVFAHAWSMSADFWEYQMNDLSRRGFRCIAFDRRGNGRSGDNGTGYDADTLAGDLAAVMEQLDLHDVTLLGHSMGGAEAVRYLARHGASRVARLVLVAAMTPYLTQAPDNPTGIDPKVIDLVCDALARDRTKWLHDNARPFFLPETPESMLRWGEAMMLQSSLRAMIESFREMMTTDFRDDLRALQLPTLVVHGTADQSIPWSFGRQTAEFVRGARFASYEGAPHGLLVTHARRLSDDIAAFASE